MAFLTRDYQWCDTIRLQYHKNTDRRTTASCYWIRVSVNARLAIGRCSVVLSTTASKRTDNSALLAPPRHLTRDVQPTNHAPQTASQHCPRPTRNAQATQHITSTSPAHFQTHQQPHHGPRATPHIQRPRYPSLRTLAWSTAAPPQRSALSTST